MGNAFDFELTATDQASASIQRIEEAVKNLIPDLDKTRDGLKLGGQESTEGIDDLNTRLKGMGQFARDGVQFIGDLVPPLKMVGEIGGKALNFGVLGAVGYLGAKAAQGLGAAADSAYSLDVAAKNAGMSVDNFSRISGAMQILGVDSDSARQSVEGLYQTFNDPLWARNDTTQALLAQNGIVIERLKDGTADVYKTLDNVAKIFPKLSTQTQKTLAEAMGLDANLLALMREGTRYKELLSKSDKFNLTVDPTLNKQLTELDRTIAEVSAAWDGLKQRGQNKLYGAILSDGSVKDGIEGVTDVVTNGDVIGLSHALGFNRGNDADTLRKIQDDKEFYKNLPWDERGSVNIGVMTDNIRQKYQNWQKQHPVTVTDQGKVTEPINTPYLLTPSTPSTPTSGQDALGVRNNNPGNLRVAPNATGKNGGFSTFANPQEGIAALSRQLQLYGDRGNNTLSGILHTYAPSTENNTQGYINAVSGATGANPYERLDLHSPEVLKKLVTAIISHENGYQPYSSQDLDNGINNSINDDRWKGLRNPNILLSQRQSLSSDGEKDPNSLLPTPQPEDRIINNKPDSILDPPNSSEKDINEITRDIGGEKTEIELTLITDKTGARRTITSPVGAKISTSMNYPS
ncbi:putative bacteriophage coat protein [Yersinia frederiksenii]|nr:putative bacteriophage coat protein [Yersinia frederiksenii]